MVFVLTDGASREKDVDDFGVADGLTADWAETSAMRQNPDIGLECRVSPILTQSFGPGCGFHLQIWMHRDRVAIDSTSKTSEIGETLHSHLMTTGIP